jgi:flagellar motility protein MotE (MotC chaperone)
MTLSYDTLVTLREQHPAWRLLASANAPLIVTFLNRAFVEPNEREIGQSDLAEQLDDELYALRQRLGDDKYPKGALAYLNDWSATEHGWIRKYYTAGSDEPYYDLTPSAEKAIGWLATLTVGSFVGTESRLLTLFQLLRQMSEGSQADPEIRIGHLERRRAQIDAEIAQITAGAVPVLDATELRDRFQQFTRTSRELLSDFRQVEQNFRDLDRGVREQIATWTDSRGELLADIIGERDAIGESDQGRNFAAFWDFLMSSSRQEELTELLEDVLALEAIAATNPDPRTRRLHYDWLDAGESAQRTVARLSKQLRRFLDDQAWLENRRIMEILRNVEANALAVRSEPPPGQVATVELPIAEINLPMERPLAGPDRAVHLADVVFDDLSAENIDHEALFNQFVVDKAELISNVRRALRGRPQISLAELCRLEPIGQGLAEIVTYLELAHSTFDAVIDEEHTDTIIWESTPPDQPSGFDAPTVVREARVPRVIFVGSR